MTAQDPITHDSLLGGRIRFSQPAEGYRAAIDPVLLAAAVPVAQGESVLDAGCGAGAAALCLMARVPGARVTGVDLDPEAVALARLNAAENGFPQYEAVEAALPAFTAAHAGVFDQVMTNPPFYEDGRHTRSPQPGKASSHGEALTLVQWVRAAAQALKPRGRLTLIHRADRIGDLLAALDAGFGAVVIAPLWPRTETAAKRLIVSAVKGRQTPPVLLPGLVLHEADGRYTAAADSILRDAQPFDLGLGSA